MIGSQIPLNGVDEVFLPAGTFEITLKQISSSAKEFGKSLADLKPLLEDELPKGETKSPNDSFNHIRSKQRKRRKK